MYSIYASLKRSHAAACLCQQAWPISVHEQAGLPCPTHLATQYLLQSLLDGSGFPNTISGHRPRQVAVPVWMHDRSPVGDNPSS